MKKIIAIFLSIVCLFLISGCRSFFVDEEREIYNKTIDELFAAVEDKNADTHSGICIFYCDGRDSNNQMQQSGGLLLMPGSTGMTPLLPPFPGRQRKRVPSGVPNSTNPNFLPVGEGFGFVVYFSYSP